MRSGGRTQHDMGSGAAAAAVVVVYIKIQYSSIDWSTEVLYKHTWSVQDAGIHLVFCGLSPMYGLMGKYLLVVFAMCGSFC